MSNIFAPWVRYNNQRVPLALGTGAVIDGYYNQLLWYTDKFSIQCVRDGVVDHISNALPFDGDGRLVVSTNDVYYHDQGVPFTALGAVAVKDAPVDFVDQGVGFTESGHMASYIDTIVIPGEEWFKEFEEPPPSQTIPIEDLQLDPAKTCISIQLVVTLKVDWTAIPDFHTFFQHRNTEASVDRFRFEKNSGIGGFAVPADVAGAFINQHPFVGAGLAGTTYDFRITLKPAGDATGPGYRGWFDQVQPSSFGTPTEFAENLTELVWDDTYLTLVALRVNQTCDLTDAEILAWPNYNPKPPTWSPMPAQFNYETDLPDTFDTSPYVNSFNGPVVNYSLQFNPPSITIDSVTGIITVAGGTAPAVYNVVVRAENDTGAPGSTGTVEWTVEAGVAPVWDVIPDQQTRANDLPTNLDVSGYVSSPTSTITGYSLVTPPTGFSINASGVITVAAGTAVAIHALTVEATNASGSANSLAFNWEILEALLEPDWFQPIPDQDDFRDELPLPLDASLSVTSNNGPLTGWSLSPNPGGFSIDSDGLIVATQAASETLHTMQVQVSNNSGPALSDPFDWNVKIFRLPPEWDPIPAQATRENLLPVDFDVSSYASSNSGALSGWAINPPVAGFTIDPAGVITAAGGTAVAVYGLTVEVTNPQGTTPTTFNWSIQEELLAPVWDTIPDQTDRENTLPQSFEASLYVDSNDGQALFAWTLINAPAGFAVDTNGRVTCQAGTAVAAHTMQVRVSNNSGTSTSATFTWNVLEELLGPQWDPIPPQSDDEDTLPQALDVSLYVDSNSGALTGWTLINTNIGFTIDGSGVVTANAGTTPGDHVVTVRVTNDTGSADGIFTWTINSVAPTEYFHEFNGSLGGFTFSRLSDGSAPDNTSERRFVGSNVGAYWGCGWSGAAFTPNAAWLGLYLERPATNLVTDSSDHFKDPPWVEFETTTVSSGDPNRMSRPDAGTAAVFQFPVLASDEYTYSVDALEVSGSEGLAYFLTVDGFATFDIYNASSIYERNKNTQTLANPQPAPGFTSTGSEDLDIANSQMELGPNQSSAIKTLGSTASRAGTELLRTYASMGLDPAAMQQGWCGQIKFYNLFDTVPAGNGTVLTILGDPGNYLFMTLVAGGELYIEFLVQGVAYAFISTTLGVPAYLELIDVRWKMESTGLTVWFNGTDEKQTDVQAIADYVGMSTVYPGGGLVPESGNLLFRTIRLSSLALPDGTIEGWT